MQEMLGRWKRDQRHSSSSIIRARKAWTPPPILLGHGFQNVRALRGGIDAWSREVDPNVPRYELE
jgi:hypothetical protein